MPSVSMPSLRKTAFGAALGLVAGACASSEPVVVASKFAPPEAPKWTYTAKRGEAAVAPCRVAVGEVRDTRLDPTTWGNIGARMVKAENTNDWLRSGFQSLSADTRLAMVDPGAADAHISISAELIKGYIQSLQVYKAAHLSVRVVFSQGGVPVGEKIFQGEDGGTNWNSGDNEAYEALNRALGQVVNALDKDLLVRCDAAKNAPPPAPATIAAVAAPAPAEASAVPAAAQ
jgi:hypothetical protein